VMGRKARERIMNEFSIDSVERKMIRLWENLEKN
jgi:hypothetical protein